jgi:hypothetical protein
VLQADSPPGHDWQAPLKHANVVEEHWLLLVQLWRHEVEPHV